MKNHFQNFFSGLIVVMILLNACSQSGVYYIDGIRGNDNNSGKSQKNAWKTVSKVNSVQFMPGDKILFSGGQVFNGTLRLKSVSGTPGTPILFSSFGSTNATIFGENSEAFVADSCNFLEIKNLNFTGSGRKDGNTTSGVIFKNCSQVLVDSLEISGFQKAGLKIADSENICVTHVHAFENGFTGILTGETYYEPFQLLSKNIYIGYCTVENNPGDPTILDNHSGSGILISGTDSVVVEYCLAKNNGWDQPWEGNGPIGIWAFHSNNVIIQHCIAHSNKSNKKGWDGGGFDFDGGVTNSVMQYNLSYNNVGPGFGLYQYWGAAPWENNVMRYNISINDGTENDSCGLNIWNGMPEKPTFKNAKVYNNVLYNDFGKAVNYNSGDVPGIYFWNNVFISKLQPVAGVHSKSVFDNNLYWQIDGEAVDFTEDLNGIFTDPKLKIPDFLNLNFENPEKLSEFDFFKPLENSPCLRSGKITPENGGFDFGGNSLNSDWKVENIGVWR